MMTFPEYCLVKKIDALKFAKEDKSLFAEWMRIFEQLNPESFTQQKKFLINPVRLKYPLIKKA